MTELNPDPVITASELAAALRENTQALQSLRNRYRLILAFVLITAMAVGFSFKVRYDACLDDNRLRTGLLNVADTLEAGGEPTPERAAFVAELRRDFALRDCVVIDL